MTNQLIIYIMGRLTMKIIVSYSPSRLIITRLMQIVTLLFLVQIKFHWKRTEVILDIRADFVFQMIITSLTRELIWASITKIQLCPLKMALLASGAKTNSGLSAPSEQIQMGDKENKTNTLTV